MLKTFFLLPLLVQSLQTRVGSKPFALSLKQIEDVQSQFFDGSTVYSVDLLEDKERVNIYKQNEDLKDADALAVPKKSQSVKRKLSTSIPHILTMINFYQNFVLRSFTRKPRTEIMLITLVLWNTVQMMK